MSEEVRTTSSSGGQKGVKPERHDLIPIDPLDWIARVYGYGAEKYSTPGTQDGSHNWRRGYEYGKSYAALQRHLKAFWSGEDVDPESGLPHLAHAGFHVNALLEWTQGPSKDQYEKFDDRYKGPEPEKADHLTFLPPRSESSGQFPTAVYWDEGRPWVIPKVSVDSLTSPIFPSSAPFSWDNVKAGWDDHFKRIMKSLFTPLVHFGVGDTVVLFDKTIGKTVRCERRFGGSWTRNDGFVLVNDREMNNLINSASRFSVIEINRQRRPWREGSTDSWREGSTDSWLDGDSVTWSSAYGREVYTRRGGDWRHVDRYTPIPGGDKTINSSIRKDLRDSPYEIIFDLVDVSHDPARVKKLGG